MRRISWNAETRDIVFRSLVALAILFVIALLQTSFLPYVDLFGAIPDLLLIFVVGVSFFNGERVGLPFSMGAGLVGYFLGGGAALSILFYFLCGVLASRGFWGRNYLSWCMYMGAACLLKLLWSFLYCLLASALPRPFAALWQSILPELLGTLLLSAVLYYPVKFAARAIKKKSEQ
ncbi:MAG: hypothetical protein E7606_01030 [Ruminococcaceae bacterium]|nr:hypothetical protein [Oscillospiraceae bacterium]